MGNMKYKKWDIHNYLELMYHIALYKYLEKVIFKYVIKIFIRES